jgi:hypothetical protein
MLHRPMSSSPARSRQATVSSERLVHIAVLLLLAGHFLNVFIFAHRIISKNRTPRLSTLLNRGVPVLRRFRSQGNLTVWGVGLVDLLRAEWTLAPLALCRHPRR